jgi:predicted acyltransferase
MSTPANDERLVSLDAFRGFTIAGMVLVNNPGDWGHLYSQLAHAEWHGWTFTDWIFPFFLFICGVSMTFSLAKRRAATSATHAHAPEDRVALMLSLWKRAAIIFLIGLALNFIPSFNLETLRIPGVLQRIALCTAIAAPIVLWFNMRQQCLWIVAILVFYSVMMLAVPVPDVNGVVGAGVLEPGRDFGAYLDRIFLTGHMWSKSKTWDPEGLFTTLPAVTTLLFGVLLGHWLASTRSNAEKTVWMMLAGLLCLWVGAMLDVVLMPINKPLWTTSYVVFMTGWALLMFAAFYWLIDGVDSPAIQAWSRRLLLPMTIYGMNALFIFAFSGLVAKMLGYIKFASDDGKMMSLKAVLYAPIQALPLSPVNHSLLFAVLFNLVMLAIGWFMWKRKWFIKV